MGPVCWTIESQLKTSHFGIKLLRAFREKLVAKGINARNMDATRSGIATRNKKLLGAPGLTTRSKKLLGTRASLLGARTLLVAPGIATRNKKPFRCSDSLSFRRAVGAVPAVAGYPSIAWPWRVHGPVQSSVAWRDFLSGILRLLNA